ncbi:hypothetical protein FA13DRAFT_1735877 [Coprinellus micaceus]|uniref:F-box domain-containing protein n=1 Tax=Coprinellus micaceus TaxID=71717 RepID=A0A4Y7T2K9_COPMI|nr:hypothetical protein FA13DRAFT_1735877 [Coprinellus micaceus]
MTNPPFSGQIVAKHSAEVNALSLEIAKMEPGVPAAKDENAQSALPTPIALVPFEVLAAIFQACIPEIASLSTICSGISSRRHPSILLSHVCNTWRTTAIASPPLWSEMYITVPAHTDPSPEAGAEWLEQMKRLRKAVDVWSTRSGNSLLRIRLTSNATHYGTGQSGDTTRDVLDSLVGAIQKAASRWREVAFLLMVGSSWELGMVELLQVPPETFPHLKRVELNIYSESFGMDGQFHTLHHMLASPGLLSTPSIRFLKLHGMWGDTSSQAITKHWPPLVSLDIDAFQPAGSNPTPVQSASQLIRLLNSLPTLTNVVFFIQGKSSRGDFLQLPAGDLPQAPRLRTLTLKGAEVPKGFTRSINLPALQDIHFQFTSLIPEGVESGIVECILQLGTQLKSLTFSPDAVNRHALVKILESLPALETLTLNPQGSGSHFRCSADRPGLTETLTNDRPGLDPDTLRCPRLRQLKLRTSRDRYKDDAVEQALVELIARRRGRSWGSGGFQLQERGPDTPDLLQELKDWDVDLHGFDLRLTYL